MRPHPTWLTLAMVTLLGCSADTDSTQNNPSDLQDMSSEEDTSPSHPCATTQNPSPYAPGLPYIAVHANPQNNDRVPCAVEGPWTQSWHTLQGKPIAQPNTFSPDARTTYVTTALTSTTECSVFALDTETGDQRWCVSVPGAINSAVEVDSDGNLYIPSNASILSFDKDGNARWSTTFTTKDPQAVGMHFTQHGEVATVTQGGTVHLLSREDGAIISSLDLPSTLGFVDPKEGKATGSDRIMERIGKDLRDLFGDELDAASGTFFGSSGKFTDNTIAIDPSGNLYITGGGPTDAHGTVIQVRVERGQDNTITLHPGFHVPLHGFSAASPVISPDGRWLKTSDGVSTGLVSDAHIQLVDIPSCPETGVCNPIHTVDLVNAQLGASPVLEDAEHIHWETSMLKLGEDNPRDLVTMKGEDDVWVLDLPDSMFWTSVVTVTDDYILGTATRITPSDEKIFTFTIPSTAESELLVVSRKDGSITYRYPITDDSAATVTVGPDGSLYVGLLAIVHSIAKDTTPTAGIIKFAPVTN